MGKVVKRDSMFSGRKVSGVLPESVLKLAMQKKKSALPGEAE